MSATALISSRAVTTSRHSNPQLWSPAIPTVAVEPWPTELDARGPTPPPKPFVAVMKALQAIPPGYPQYVRTNEEPADLLRALEKRGVDGSSRRLPDGTWKTLLTYNRTATGPC
jgi:hypothetical protein